MRRQLMRRQVMRRRAGKASLPIILGLVAIALLAGAAWWYLNQGSMRIAISKEQILERLSEKLPTTKTYLYIFKVTYDSPRVELIDASKRINAGLDLSVQITLLSDPEPLRGRIDAAAGVRYDSSVGAFYLEDPTIERLELDNLPQQWAAKARDVVEEGVSSYFKTRPIYTLTEKQSHRAAKAVLQDITIEDDQVVLHLGDPNR